MRIISHRGYWKSVEEKNTEAAFERSFASGYGTETDLRDLDGSLVISHDPAHAGCMTAERMFEIHAAHDSRLPLALNVKADGLQDMVVALIERFRPSEAYVFDMSVPDTLQWIRRGVPVYVRHSDVETSPVLYEDAVGVWLDAFHSDWWTVDVIKRHVDAGKRVCLVSPDLHRRPHAAVWEALASDTFIRDSDRVTLCTDFPDDAKESFS